MLRPGEILVNSATPNFDWLPKSKEQAILRVEHALAGLCNRVVKDGSPHFVEGMNYALRAIQEPFAEDDIEAAVIAVVKNLRGKDLSDFETTVAYSLSVARAAIKEPDCLKGLQWADVWERRDKYPWCRAGETGAIHSVQDPDLVHGHSYFARRDFQVFKERALS